MASTGRALALVSLAALLASLSGACGGSTLPESGGSAGSGNGSGSGAGSGGSGSNMSTSGTSSGSSDAGSGFPANVLTKANKVDILFDIDNSASMGDKQAYLAQAIPDLITRLVTSRTASTTRGASSGTSDTSGNCATGTAEFPPVHDMHIGIVSSSLGNRLGDACLRRRKRQAAGNAKHRDADAPGRQGSVDRHNDDQAHLLDRAALDARRTSRNYQETDGARRRRHERGRRPLPRLVPVDATRVNAGVDPDRSRADHGPGRSSRAASRRWSRRPPVRLRHRVAARELVPLPHPAGPVRVAGRPEPGQVQRLDALPRAVGRRRHDDPRAARRLPPARLARRDPRPHRRERLRGRRPVLRRVGLQLHDLELAAAARDADLRDEPRRPELQVVRVQRHGGRPGLRGQRRRLQQPDRLGLRPQPPPRAREAEVRRLGAVPDPALRASVSRRPGSPTATASTRRTA